ncbi:hypothetical protein I4U23_003951 [Adineta vaga]|nr:hypothetical protein I4U23_003951 [Adineta vaga]
MSIVVSSSSSSYVVRDPFCDDVRVTYVRRAPRRVYTVYEVEEPVRVVVDAAPVVKYRITTTTKTRKTIQPSSSFKIFI